ncbi:phage tail spike protein [Enterococcus sp. LJL128]
MILYFTDRKFNVLGLASTGDLPNALSFYDDLEVQEIEKGSAVLTGYLSIKNNLSEINQLTQTGNYILIQDEDELVRFYTIIRKEKNRQNKEVFIYAEDAGLDLLNEVLGSWEAPAKEQPISYYVNKAIYDSGFEIGRNELSDITRKAAWSNEETATKRLLSIAEEFNQAEFSFRFEVNGMRITKKYIDIYKKRGNDTQVELRLNRDIHNIVTEETIENLATAFRVYGGTGSGNSEPITLSGYKYDDGRYYTDGIYLKDRKALSIWSRYLVESGDNEGHIVANFHYDTLSKQELCNQAIGALKKRSEPEVNYEVDIAFLPENVRIGDTINIVDDEDELYLQARVLKLERSRANQSAQAVLGNYLIQSSGINQRLQDLADKIQLMKDGDTYFPWIRYADDDEGTGISGMPTGKQYMAIKYGLNQPIPSDDPKEYEGLWVKIIGEDGINGKDGIQGPPGQDGLPKYTWIQYADDINGTNMSNESTGKKYIGFAHNKSEPTPSSNPREYNWSAMYDNELIEIVKNELDSIPVTTVSAVEPLSPKNGDNWFKTDLQGTIIGFYIFNNEWKPRQIDQGMLAINKLVAVDIEGAKITGTEVQSAFDREIVTGAPIRRKGTIKMSDGRLRVDFVQYDVSDPDTIQATGMIHLDEGGIISKSSYTSGKNDSFMQLGSGSLSFNSSLFGSGSLTAESLVSKPWQDLPLTTNFQHYGTDKCQYKKVKNLDGSYTVKFRGIMTTKAGVSWATGQSIANMPLGTRPSQTEIAIQPTNLNGIGGRLHVVANGEVVFRPQTVSGLTYVSLSNFSYDIEN